MSRISAADNLIIVTHPDRWQMLVNTEFVETVNGDSMLMEAIIDQPLRYTTVFARTRRLPKSGTLATDHIQRVVLGWSWEDEAWHLGLLCSDALARARGSRWCELAKWPDPERDVFRDLAVDAGRSLANIIDCPFNIVPTRQQHIEKTKPQPRPLPTLPLEVPGWLFEQQPNGWLAFVRDGAWARERVRRMLWYSFWTVVYIILAVTTLVSDIALPRPAFLPYLGLATAALLVGLVGYSLYELRRKPRRILVDPETRQIWGAVDEGKHKPIWRMSREAIDSVYVSQVIKQQQEQPIMQYGEINLRLTNGGYYYLLNQEEAEPLTAPPNLNGNAEIVPLDGDDIQTPLQVAGAYIGKALNVPVWYDHRVR